MTRAAFIALAGLLLAGAAHAQSTSAPGADQPAAGQATSSPEAASGGGGMREGMGAMREACAADMKTYCGDAGQDRGARRQCMMAHQAQFSPGCQDAIAKMRAWREAHPRNGGGSPQ